MNDTPALLVRRFEFLAARYERQYEAARAGRPCDFAVKIDTEREAGETVARARDAGFLHLPGLPDATEWLAAAVDSPGPDRPAVLVRDASNYWLLALGCLHRERPDAFPGLRYLSPAYAEAWTPDTAAEYRADTAWANAEACRLLAGMIRARPAGSHAIPHDKRTKPMTKAEALNYIGWPSNARTEREARDWLTRSIRAGEYRWERINSKSGVYHLDDFNPECWDQIRAH